MIETVFSLFLSFFFFLLWVLRPSTAERERKERRTGEERENAGRGGEKWPAVGEGGERELRWEKKQRRERRKKKKKER